MRRSSAGFSTSAARDLGGFERAAVAEIRAQQVRPNGELAYARPRRQRAEILDPLACAAMSCLDRREASSANA
jgi:hypothetical protein